MAATTRWVEYSVADAGYGKVTNSGIGTRGFSKATASVGDSFDIGLTTDRLYLTIDGDTDTNTYITLASGSDLDPRFVAKEITERIHNLVKTGNWEDGYDYAQCFWENDDGTVGNHLKIYSGSLGTGSQVAVISGTNTAHLELGFGTKTESNGASTTVSGYSGGITVSGTYDGFFDETYTVVISKGTDSGGDPNIGTPNKGGSNHYTGTMTEGGVFTNDSAITYTISIDVTNGTTVHAGTGNVPIMEWTSTDSADDSAGDGVELLLANYWYNVGTKGLKVKFTDDVFDTVDPAWTIACKPNDRAEGSNVQASVGTAKFIYTSTRGDDWVTAATTSTNFVGLGSRGLSIKWSNPDNLVAGDTFYVVCRPPQPYAYDRTNLNYGNVTVSTESPVKVLAFEITSGAVEISSVKFGLQNDGSFSYHTAEGDTKFRFGTVGPGYNAAGTKKEWHASVLPGDIDSDIAPSFLYATKENLEVVSDADNSELIGASAYAGMVADPIWLCVKLGSSEVGANSTINYRVYFDYS